ncbi:hypothetical protein L208DRAFT_1520014, partial [Tricholoma matsutake]
MGLFLSLQINVHMIFCIHFSICLGICCTCVRYCVEPPMIICASILCPSIVGLEQSHPIRVLSIFSIIGDQGVVLGAPFPSHALRIWINSPSFAMWILSGIFSCSSFALLSQTKSSLKALLPIRIIWVLLVLNWAPAVRHQWSRIRVRSVRESSFIRKVVVSSANSVAKSFSWVPGMIRPCRLDFHS